MISTKQAIRKALNLCLLIGLTGLLNLSSTRSIAQTDISLEYRPRTEYQRGFGSLATPNQEYALFTAQRSRLNLSVKKEKYQVKLVLQDVRTWGSQRQLVANDGALTTIHESYGIVFLKPYLSAKIGRQEIIYDDHRIFGNVAWAQQARSHDAFLFQYKKGKTKADLAFAFNQNGPNLKNNFYSVNGSYKTMQYLWANHKFTDHLNASILALNVGQQSGVVDTAEVKNNQTFGTRITYKKDKIKAHLASYAQMGETTNSVDINALYYMAEVYYKLHKNHELGAAYEVLSGNDMFSNSNEQNAFNPLFGTNHKFNGFMDYFYVGNHGGNVGLNDLFIKYTWNPENPWSVTAFIHQFNSNGVVKKSANSDAMESNLGNEIDLVINWKKSKDYSIQIGYSHMLATETMQQIKGGDYNETNNFAWLMLTLKPQLLSIK